jgi:DNA-binding MarR family transcriptional regulator
MRQEAAGLVTPSQLSALTTIAKHGDLSLGELAAVERVAPPSMTRIAARLEESGLVARRTDAADRRVSRVVATDEGHALLEATQHRRDLFLATRLQELTDDERDLVARAVPVLERLARED